MVLVDVAVPGGELGLAAIDLGNGENDEVTSMAVPTGALHEVLHCVELGP